MTATDPAPAPPASAGVSAPGSRLILHQTTSELLALIERGAAAYAPFPPQLVATWRSGFPPASDRGALSTLLKSAGWPQLLEATSRARIAALLAASQRGEGDAAGLPPPQQVAQLCDFEAVPDAGQDRWAVFLAAGM